MTVKKLLVGVAVAMFAASAHAGVFIGGGVGYSSYNYDDVDDSSGTQLYVGYAADNGVFLEVAKVELGDADVDSTSLSLEMNGMAYYVGYQVEDPSLGYYLKVGGYSLETKLDPLGLKEDSSGLAFGLGLVFSISRSVAFRAGMYSFVGVEDFADDESVTGWSLTAELRF